MGIGNSIIRPGQIGPLMSRVHQGLREAFETRLEPVGITPAEWGILSHLRHGVETPAELADCLGVNRAAVTRLLERLTEIGLVERAPNPDDRRSILVRPSARGAKAAEQAAELAEEVGQTFTAGLENGEREEFGRLLHKVARTIPGRRRLQDGCPHH
jgi:DNA-binding MarR family transcriptional regulator